MDLTRPEPRPDGRQSATALMIQRGVARLLRAANFAVLPEFTLASGRRADLIGISDAGEIWIVEIKSSPEDFRSDSKWPEYRDWCDRLFFAISTGMAPEIMPTEAGLIVALPTLIAHDWLKHRAEHLLRSAEEFLDRLGQIAAGPEAIRGAGIAGKRGLP